MATSIRQFNVELYREHLEEASFLYEQRLAYLHDPEVNWPDLRDWEERFEAHIDALVVGGELALDICRQQAADGDAGEMHAALRVFCRQDRKDHAFAVLDTLDPTDDDVVRAVAQALCRDAGSDGATICCTSSGAGSLTNAYSGEGDRISPLSVRSTSQEHAGRTAVLGCAELAWALGRVGTAASVPLLWPLVGSDDQHVCEAAAIALMRLGDDRPLQRAMHGRHSRLGATRARDWRKPESVRLLLDALKSQSADADGVLALGLLGDLAPWHRCSTCWMTTPEGACRRSPQHNYRCRAVRLVFVPDDVDPDEFSEDERLAYEKAGTLPTRHGDRLATGNAVHFSTRRSGVHGSTRTSIASIDSFVGAWEHRSIRRRCSSV